MYNIFFMGSTVTTAQSEGKTWDGNEPLGANTEN
jgi:hypothetical protein